MWTVLGGTLFIWGFPGGSVVKNPPAMWETWAQSLGQEDAREESMATHSSILAWKISWTEKLGGLRPMELQRVKHGLGTKQQVFIDTEISRKATTV